MTNQQLVKHVRIGFVTAFPPERDGIADYCSQLIKSIGEETDDISFYVMARHLKRKADHQSIPSKTKLFRIWQMKTIRSTLRSILALSKVIVDSKVDILHFQFRFTREAGGTAGEPLSLMMLIAKKILRKPKIVVSLHDFWLPKEAEERAYELTRSKILARLYRWYYTVYIKAALSIPHLILSVVNSRKSPVTKYIQSFTKQEVREILHGLPELEHDKEPNTGSSVIDPDFEKKGFTILLFGFIRRSKAYQYVIHAVKKTIDSNPDLQGKIRLLIAGIPSSPDEEPYLHYLKELTKKLDIENSVSIIRKYLSVKEVDNLFKGADLTVISYARRVGPSGVLSFALAYEVPSIITVDAKYVTRDMIFPAVKVNLNADEIASAIVKLVTNPYESRKQIERIREYKKLNNNSEIARSHLRFYRKLSPRCWHV